MDALNAISATLQQAAAALALPDQHPNTPARHRKELSLKQLLIIAVSELAAIRTHLAQQHTVYESGKFYSIKDAAKIAGMEPRSLDALIKRGELRSYGRPNARRVRIEDVLPPIEPSKTRRSDIGFAAGKGKPQYAPKSHAMQQPTSDTQAESNAA